MKAKDLRNSILQLAVQGKLVPQDPNDEPASVLLDRIRAERAKLVKEKKIKAPKDGESVIYRASDGSHYEKRVDARGHVLSERCIDDEIPFEIPKRWEWARLGSIASVLNGDRGKNYPAKSKLTTEGIPFVSAVNINNGLVVEDQMLYMTDKQFSSLRAGKLQQNDIVFCIRGSLGKFGIFPFKQGAIASSLVIVRPFLSLDVLRHYLFCLLDSPMTGASIRNYDNGTAQPNLAAKNLEQFLYPIPSLEEQLRIMKQLEESLPIVDAYGSLEETRDRLDTELPDRLRKSILQMAIQGRLIEQDPSDEPASVLLGCIREERRKLVAEGKAKAPKGGESVIYRASDGGYYEKRIDAKGRESEPVCIDDEIPFEIPESWEWARLASLIELISGVDLSPRQYNAVHDGIPYLTGASNFDNGTLIENRWTCVPRRIAMQGDLLFTCKGTVGEMAINTFEEAHIARQIMAIRPIDVCTLDFIELFLASMVENIKTAARGVIPGIERSALLDAYVPIPPYAEQQRIVHEATRVLAIIG